MNNLVKDFTVKLEEIFYNKLPKRLAVAVSGGADSLALTLLLQEFCLARKIKLFALTLDHKMRKSSTKEARQLSLLLQQKKIAHEILTIADNKIPQKNIEAQLREVRYELLEGFCKKNKIEFLFLGHHQGDVAENFLIRLFRGSGLDGLSTMAEISHYKKIHLLRPLLNVEKDELKNFLHARKITWFEDETNEDEKFLRNKIRKFFESFPEKNLIQKRVKNASDEIAEMRDFFDVIMLDKAKEIVELRARMNFVIERKKFCQLHKKIALKLLALILMEVSGEIYKPRLEKVQNLYEYLQEGNQIKSRNFFGCVVKKFDEKNIIIAPQKAQKPSLKLRTILQKIL